MASDTKTKKKKAENGLQTKANKKQLIMRTGAALNLLAVLAGIILPLYNPGSPIKNRKKVMTVNSHDISADEFEYFLSNEISRYVNYYGGSYFADKKNMSDLLNYVSEEITFYYAFLDWAEENGYGQSQEQKDAVTAKLQESKSQFENEEKYREYLDSIYATEKVLFDTECMFDSLNDFYDHLTDPVNGPYAESARKLAEDPESFNIYGAKHILFLLNEQTDGEGRTDEQTKALAEEVLKQIRDGADFDELMKEYGEDPGMAEHPEGYTFTDGEFVEEFYNATAAMEIGEVSGLVRSSYGYHIIKRIEPDIDEAAQKIVMKLYGTEIDSHVAAADVKLSRGFDSIEYNDFRISAVYPADTAGTGNAEQDAS